MKIRPVGAEFFHADGRTDERTDMTKLIVAFRNFANAPNNGYLNGGANKERAGEGGVNWREMWSGLNHATSFRCCSIVVI
jgi:hypothetical protein